MNASILEGALLLLLYENRPKMRGKDIPTIKIIEETKTSKRRHYGRLPTPYPRENLVIEHDNGERDNGEPDDKERDTGPTNDVEKKLRKS